MIRCSTIGVSLAILAALCPPVSGQETQSKAKFPAKVDPANYDRLRTGDSADGRIVVPTNQVLSPAGRQVAFSGRPTDVTISPDGRWLAVLDRNHVAIIDLQTADIVSRVRADGFSGSVAGLAFTPDGKTLLASNIRGSIGV